MTYVYLYPTHEEAKRAFEKKVDTLKTTRVPVDKVNVTKLEIIAGLQKHRYIVVPISIGTENIMGLQCICDPSRVIQVLKAQIEFLKAETFMMKERLKGGGK